MEKMIMKAYKACCFMFLVSFAFVSVSFTMDVEKQQDLQDLQEQERLSELQKKRLKSVSFVLEEGAPKKTQEPFGTKQKTEEAPKKELKEVEETTKKVLETPSERLEEIQKKFTDTWSELKKVTSGGLKNQEDIDKAINNVREMGDYLKNSLDELSKEAPTMKNDIGKVKELLDDIKDLKSPGKMKDSINKAQGLVEDMQKWIEKSPLSAKAKATAYKVLAYVGSGLGALSVVAAPIVAVLVETGVIGTEEPTTTTKTDESTTEETPAGESTTKAPKVPGVPSDEEEEEEFVSTGKGAIKIDVAKLTYPSLANMKDVKDKLTDVVQAPDTIIMFTDFSLSNVAKDIADSIVVTISEIVQQKGFTNEQIMKKVINDTGDFQDLRELTGTLFKTLQGTRKAGVADETIAASAKTIIASLTKSFKKLIKDVLKQIVEQVISIDKTKQTDLNTQISAAIERVIKETFEEE